MPLRRCVGRAVRAALAACVIASVAVRAQAADIVWHVSRADDALAIEASARLRADLPGAWHVLTDYDRYAQFIPGLDASHVIVRRGADVVVRQSVEVTLWLFRAPVDVTYEITEEAPSRIVSRTVGGCACTLDSTYTLRRDGADVRLDYRGRLVTGSGVASLFENAAGERTAMRQFRALADEIEARARHETSVVPWHVAK
jgi:carbon monoxide dehydrogenase subunit G